MTNNYDWLRGVIRLRSKNMRKDDQAMLFGEYYRIFEISAVRGTVQPQVSSLGSRPQGTLFPHRDRTEATLMYPRWVGKDPDYPLITAHNVPTSKNVD